MKIIPVDILDILAYCCPYHGKCWRGGIASWTFYLQQGQSKTHSAEKEKDSTGSGRRIQEQLRKGPCTSICRASAAHRTSRRPSRSLPMTAPSLPTPAHCGHTWILISRQRISILFRCQKLFLDIITVVLNTTKYVQYKNIWNRLSPEPQIVPLKCCLDLRSIYYAADWCAVGRDGL